MLVKMVKDIVLWVIKLSCIHDLTWNSYQTIRSYYE